MLSHRRDECMKSISWAPNDQYHDVFEDPAASSALQRAIGSVQVLEAFSYQNNHEACKGRNWRLTDLCKESDYGIDSSRWLFDFMSKLERLLNQTGEFSPPKPSDSAELRGGFRLVMCDRPNMQPAMTITRRAFQRLEEEFELHAATLPAFVDHGGKFTMSLTEKENGEAALIKIVIKVTQKVEIGNQLLSLTHDVGSNWTNAFLCGDGALFRRKSDGEFGSQLDQLLAALTMCNTGMWTLPLLLPTALLELCARRSLTNVNRLERRLIRVEDHLGVTFALGAQGGQRGPQWPMDLDVEWATRSLHSLLPQLLGMTTVTSWQKRLTTFLLDIKDRVNVGPMCRSRKRALSELETTMSFITSTVNGMVESYDTWRGRAQSQIDLLFSVIAQRDAINSQIANDLNLDMAGLSLEMARSTKEDSISMTTFTFITAIFLPPSFVAALFSMGMFNWSTDVDGAHAGSGAVSRNFWIFWVVAIPLTALTMSGWYMWYRLEDRKWRKRFEAIDRRRDRSFPSVQPNQNESGMSSKHKTSQPIGLPSLSRTDRSVMRRRKEI